MAGKAKFDKEAAFKSIVGVNRQQENASAVRPAVAEGRNRDRVQRSYFIDRDLDKALRRMAIEEDKNLTESMNEILRSSLAKYL